jgi:chitosanase
MPALSKEQKHVIDCVLAIFETGKVPTAKSYSTCTVLSDGAGISYGKHQATDKAGSLDAIVKAYIAKKGKHAAELTPYLPAIESSESAKADPKNLPANVKALVELLKKAGEDPIMQACQDEVFDANYFSPALKHAEKAGVKTALAVLVIYDTCIHSGPGGVDKIRAKFAAKSPATGGTEKEWVVAYIQARREWLLANSNPIVQKCVYRQDALMDLVKADNWDLKMPLTVRGQKIA